VSLVCAGSAGRRVEAELVEGAAVWGRLPFPVLSHENMFATRRHTPATRAGMCPIGSLGDPGEDNDGNNRQGEDEGSTHRQHCVLSLIGL